MQIQDILRVKGHQVHSIAPGAALQEAIETLVRLNIGSLLVVHDGQPVGIVTERDILRACAKLAGKLEESYVEQIMTREVVTGNLQDELSEVMGVMTERRVRHLPIMDQGRLAGMISIGDIVKAQHHQLTAENHLLKTYILS